MNARASLHHIVALVLTLCCAAPARADDIDIYFNPAANGLQPPATVIVLDLNLLGICDNVLTDPGSSGGTAYGSSNPLGASACFNLRAQTLTSYLTSIGKTPTTVLTTALTTLGPAGLCSLYTTLGLTSPTISSGLLGLGLLGCSTLSLLTNPLLSLTVVANFTSSLVSGLLNPLLSTTLAALPTAVAGAVNTTLAGVGTILADPLSVNNLFSTLGSILNNLVNSRVAILVMHANRGNLTGTPSTYTANDGNAYACQFNDLTYGSSVGATGSRSSTSNSCSNGAYFLFGFRNLVDQTTINTLLTDLQTKLNNLLNPLTLTNALTGLAGAALSSSDLTPPLQNKEGYDEILHYIFGDPVYNGPLAKYDGLTGLLTRDTSIESGGNYVAPSLSCRTVNVLNIDVSDSRAAVDSDSDTDAGTNYFPGVTLRAVATANDPDPGFTNLLTAAGSSTGITRKGNTIQLNSYFVVQNNLSSLTALSNIGANVLNYASAVGLLGLGQSIAQFMQPVLVTDATLLTTSVAGSRSSSTGLLTPAFLPEFRPESSRKPNWAGNVKQLRLQQNATTGAYSFVASNGVAGLSATDGRINPAALTFWTRTSTALLGGAAVDGRTTTLGGAGQNIPGYAYGGGGYPGRVNADAKRKLYYDQVGPAITSLGNLDADTQSVRDDLKVDLGDTGTAASDDTLRRSLLLFARGFDVGTIAAPKGTGSTVSNVVGRPWLLGAVLHSRPVAVNYGARSGYSQTDPDIRVLFGSTDGFLHSVQNGHVGVGSDTVNPSGVETWAFMPRTTMPNLSTLRADAYSASFPYGVDGAPAVLLIDRGTSTTISGGGPADGVIDSNNPNDHAYAFFGLRRGGSNYYGLDITNPDTPTLMWRIGTDGLYSANTSSPGFATGSAAWFAELGQTFSTPAIGSISYINSSNQTVQRSVLLFAGGYSGGVNSSGTRVGKDLNNSRNSATAAQVGVDDTRGNAIYMVDALTGQLIWKAVRSPGSSIVAYDPSTMSFKNPLLADGFASDVTAIDSDGDGITDRLYVGDTGGRVWRADFPSPDRSTWTAGPIASLGRSHTSADATNANDRRFFHAPDFIPSRGQISTTVNGTIVTSIQNFDVVAIGSGDREDPFNTTTGNWFYAIRDRDTVSGKSLTDTTTANGVISSDSDSRLLKQTDLVDLTASCAATSTGVCLSGATLPNGWRLQLTGSGEKTVSVPVTIYNAVVFSTFTPPAASSTSCSPNEGSSKIYGVNLVDSRPYVAQFINDGDGSARSTSANAGIAGEVTGLTPQLLEVNSAAVNLTPPPTYRTFWRERREEEPDRVKQ